MGLASAAERELAGSTPSQIFVGLKGAYEDPPKTKTSDTKEASGGFDVVEGSRGAAVVAGRCISARLIPQVARYATPGAVNFNPISLTSFRLPFLQLHQRLPSYLLTAAIISPKASKANSKAAPIRFGLYPKISLPPGVNIKTFSDLAREPPLLILRTESLHTTLPLR